MKRKICVFTGTRAEFGLLFWIIDDLHKDKSVDLKIVVTGMHLSPEFGFTYREIEKAGFPIAKKVEILLSSDSPVGISKSMGLGMISFSEVLAELKPDVILILGDRFEVFCVAAAAMIARIPVAHIHGGEATEGIIDEPIRHAITKMSHLHFTATEEYRKRVIQLGEQPENVFNFGTPGIDNILKLNLLSKNELEKSIGFILGKKSAMVTFHPVTLEFATAEDQFRQLLRALSEFEDINIIFTKPNADTDGRIIIRLIDEYVEKNRGRCISFHSLGQIRYLSVLKYVDFVLGNSSSGLIEAPSFKIPTINIGDRQRGRIKAESVIDCNPSFESIVQAISLALSSEFRLKIKDTINPYGKAGASKQIASQLKTKSLNNILKKPFYNI